MHQTWKLELNRTFAAVFAITALLWCCLWGFSDDHKFGDSTLAKEFYYSGEWFADYGFKSHGLAIYTYISPTVAMHRTSQSQTVPGDQWKDFAYTHVTPGPEWMEGIIHLPLKFLNIVQPETKFHYHAIVTSLLSMFLLIQIVTAVISLYRLVSPASLTLSDWNSKRNWLLLIGFSAPSFQTFSGHPHQLAILLCTLYGLKAINFWIKDPTPRNQFPSLLYMGAVCTLAFWMGIFPLAFVGFWCFGVFTFFGTQEQIKVRAIRVVAFLTCILIGNISLKWYQNYLFYGNWESVFADSILILKYRQGIGAASNYSVIKHFLKLIWRPFFLFGAGSFILVQAILKKEHSNAKTLLLILLGGGILWQVGMRQHGFNHIYMLNSLVSAVLFACCFIEFNQKSLWNRSVFGIPFKTWLPVAQTILLWGTWLIPGVLRIVPK